ncbi:MAG: pyridoxamine 5'-phosphate oxidase family protein [Halieaceae bacterium]|nr:pyridoxamine 5'-phosphate oxidase family protein [Halieaceae bacterium]
MSPYPQMPPLTADELAEFLTTTPVARLASHNPDGSIHLSPV